jgi:hypothetical protein
MIQQYASCHMHPVNICLHYLTGGRRIDASVPLALATLFESLFSYARTRTAPRGGKVTLKPLDMAYPPNRRLFTGRMSISNRDENNFSHLGIPHCTHLFMSPETPNQMPLPLPAAAPRSTHQSSPKRNCRAFQSADH